MQTPTRFCPAAEPERCTGFPQWDLVVPSRPRSLFVIFGTLHGSIVGRVWHWGATRLHARIRARLFSVAARSPSRARPSPLSMAPELCRPGRATLQQNYARPACPLNARHASCARRGVHCDATFQPQPCGTEVSFGPRKNLIAAAPQATSPHANVQCGRALSLDGAPTQVTTYDAPSMGAQLPIQSPRGR